MSKIRLSGIISESIVDGPGLRFVVFSQGCPHKCKGCHNPQTFDVNGGYEMDTNTILEEVKKNPLISGITFSGGEPFLQAEQFSDLAKKSRKLGLNVMSYTGYVFEDLLKKLHIRNDWKKLLENIDILVDGPFDLAKKSLLLKFRGSENQRIIDVKKSLKNGHAVIME